MADYTLNDIIQGLIDVDRNLIERVVRGSGTYAILDINTPDKGGSGTEVTDNAASLGKAISITTSSSANLVPYTGTFPDIKFGHYAICARIKTNNLTSSHLVQLKVLNGDTEILAANFKGTDFDNSTNYSYLYSTFTYEGSTKGDLTFQIYLLTSSVKINFDYAYISMTIPSVFV
jgi:hypothetical protein